MKDCLLIEDGKNMKTLFGISYYTEYSFYFSFRTTKTNDEVFYFNHENVLGIYSKKSDNGTHNLHLVVYNKTIKVVDSIKDKWYVISVINKGESCDVCLDGVKVETIDLNGAAKPKVTKPGMMISGATFTSDVILFNKIHDDKVIKDMNYWLTNI